MDKIYDNKKVEEKIYKDWEKRGYFKPEVNSKGNPYCIILPPPNANGNLHFGHAMMCLEDILIRYHRMKGDSALFLPGADHAGFETQFVFEKKLQAEGKSRFDYTREELYEKILDYVMKNKSNMEDQLRKLGFSVDWSREKFPLDKDIVALVYKAFKKLADDGLVYRGDRLVNYCTFDGTSFSDLEVVYEERKNPLYYLKYGPLVLATTRPETKFGDTAVAVNPSDKRYEKYVGKELEIETVLGKAKIKVVADKMVDPEFGTGVVKITPAHDFDDFEVAKRHNLPMVQVINHDGKMNEKAGKFAGLYVKQARKAVVEEMQEKGLIEKIDDEYVHRIGLCYKCKNPIEPLPLEQWYIKTEKLAKDGIKVVKEDKIKFYPKNFEKRYFQWMENLKDWNVSRQIVWGIRIPAWKCEKCNEWIITEGDKPRECKCGSKELTQDPDTFDTWFSSGQWPIVTLKTGEADDFNKFYPTSVMETGYDILPAWVSRMIMLGFYLTKQVPFKDVVLHGLVNDPYGKKMSKSKGNVVNPLEVVDQYGADSVRLALVYGTALGNDQALSYPKLQAMRNFSNKLWNMGRFIQMQQIQNPALKIQNIDFKELNKKMLQPGDKLMIEKIEQLVKEITKLLDNYDFNHAAQNLYDFAWHQFADKYIEDVKTRINQDSFNVLTTSYLVLLKLLHPFMPFITEEINKQLWKSDKQLIVSSWPN
ncbi:valine--tRNA ligase [Patescibacteria group bacterium]|nr:valine--tRNA ligase [Patescibacteria group bacterium]